MSNFLTTFKERKLGLLEKFKNEYAKNLQAEITLQLDKRSKSGLDFAAHAYNKFQSIKSRINATAEPSSEKEFVLTMQNLDQLEAEFNAWLETYYYELYPIYKPKKYGA